MTDSTSLGHFALFVIEARRLDLQNKAKKQIPSAGSEMALRARAPNEENGSEIVDESPEWKGPATV